MVLAHRERLDARSRPRPTWPRSGCATTPSTGTHLGPLPAPGVFARHNAVDTPALLPDGIAVGDLGLAGAAPRAARSAPSADATPTGRWRRTSSDRRGRGADGDPTEPLETTTDGGGPTHERRRRSSCCRAILFTIGCVGVLTRRNAIVVFMCVELMLNASNLALVAFAGSDGNLDGQIAAFFVMVVAAAEVVVGLAIIMTIFRTRRSASVDDASLLKY